MTADGLRRATATRHGRTILITGATDGLGRALSRHFAASGWDLLVHGRNRRKVAALTHELRTGYGASARGCLADYRSLAQVRAMASTLARERPNIAVVINNAGVGIEETRTITSDGFELVFQVNFLSTHLLTLLLLDGLRAGGAARVINVASAGQHPMNLHDLQSEIDWSGAAAYGRSKLALVMATIHLAERHRPAEVTFNSVHPASLMPTKLVLGRYRPISTIEQGVENVVRLATDPSLAGATGQYFENGAVSAPHALAFDGGRRAALMANVEQMLAPFVAHEETGHG